MTSPVIRRRVEIGVLEFGIGVIPKPWARPRLGNSRRGYTPPDVEAHRETVRWCGLQARAKWEKLHGRPWPRSKDHEYTLSVRAFRARRAGDWDNFGKQIGDALEGTLFPDDRQIRLGESGWIDPGDEEWSGTPRYEVRLVAYEVKETKRPRVRTKGSANE
jgi:Holliday junction resolvase RusA-like endonuclease